MVGPCRQLALVRCLPLLLSGKCAGDLCGVSSNRVCCEDQEELESWRHSPQHVQSMGSVFVVYLPVQGGLTPHAPDLANLGAFQLLQA